MTKEQVILCLQELPEPFKVDHLIARLLALRAMEDGLAQRQRGETVTVAEAKRRLAFAGFLQERLAESDRDEGISLAEARRRLAAPDESDV